MATYGDGRAGVWAIADLAGRGHLTGRSFDLSEPDDIRRIVADQADYQPDLQPELKAFLGKAYEDLLSTDVYARWARGRRPAAAHPRPDAEPQPEAFPAGLDPGNPLHALAVLERDGVVKGGDPATSEALAAALGIHEAEQADVAAWGEELTAAVPDELRARWLKQGEKLAGIRRDLEETAKMDIPDISHDDQVAHAEAQWRQIGEKTVIPDAHRARLLELLAVKVSAAEVARVLEVTPWTARTYLERLRLDGLAQAVGKGRGAGWVAAQPPEDGDGP
jgi:hypothetical protein